MQKAFLDNSEGIWASTTALEIAYYPYSGDHLAKEYLYGRRPSIKNSQKPLTHASRLKRLKRINGAGEKRRSSSHWPSATISFRDREIMKPLADQNTSSKKIPSKGGAHWQVYQMNQSPVSASCTLINQLHLHK